MELSVLLQLLVPFIGGLFVGPAFSIYTRWEDRKKERATTRASIIAEISALLDLIYLRRYQETLAAGAKGLILGLEVDVPESYFQVYRANLQKLGLLDPSVAEHIVYFYALLEAITQDVKPGGALNNPKVDQPQRQEGYAEDAELLRQAIEIGETLRGK